MVPSLLLLSSILGQARTQPAAILAADAFLDAGNGVALEYVMTGGSATGPCSLTMIRGAGQVFNCHWQGTNLEYRQTSNSTIVIRHDVKGYDEYPGSSVMAPPHPRMIKDAEYAIPFFVYWKNLSAFAQGSLWRPAGNEEVQGVATSVWYVDYDERSRLGGRHSVWITASGRIVRWRRTVPAAEGTTDYNFEFSRFDSIKDADQGQFLPDLPIGYLPLRLPLPRTMTIDVQSKVVLGKWYDARANKTADFAIRAKGSPVLLVFTDPESEICAKIEPLLVELRRSLKRHGCGVVEVVYSASAPTVVGKDKDRSVVWDKDGSIERAYGTPGTPYFLMADAKGVLCRGWQGYRDDERKKIVAHFTGFFTEKKTTDAKPARKG